MKFCKNCKKILCKNNISNLCIRCFNKKRKGKTASGYIDGRTLNQYFCIDCQEKISYGTWKYGLKRCRSCSRRGKLHPNWKNGIKTAKYHCIDCNKIIYYNTYMRGQKRCISCSRIFRFKNPKNHPCWQGGIDKLPYGIKWTRFLKEQIRQRDDYTCQLCRMKEIKNRIIYKNKLSIHHIDYNKLNCKENNLITLCQRCNSKVNANRDYWYAYFRYIITI